MREVERSPELVTYYTDGVAEDSGGGKRIQNGDDRVERFGDSGVNGFIEGACLCLEDTRDGLGRIAMLEWLGKWVFRPWFSRLFCISPQGRLEKDGKV
jgi:hypothetical protein